MQAVHYFHSHISKHLALSTYLTLNFYVFNISHLGNGCQKVLTYPHSAGRKLKLVAPITENDA